MQISRGVHTEVSEESVVSTVAEGTRNGVSRIGQTAGERGAGGPSDGRSCAYAALNTAEAFGVGGDGIREGQKRYSRGPGVCWPEAEFCGPALLARGYWVSTVGKDEAAVRRYIQEQEKEDQRLDQLELPAL